MLFDFVIIFSAIFYNMYYTYFSEKNIKWKKRIMAAITLLYIFAVIDVTLLGRAPALTARTKLELFWSYKIIWIYPWGRLCKAVVGNVILFIPLGLILQNYFSKHMNVAIAAAAGFCCSLGIELTQLMQKTGLFEYDDLFHNTLGAVIGSCLFYAIMYWKSGSENKIPRVVKILLPGIVYGVVVLAVNSRPCWEIFL